MSTTTLLRRVSASRGLDDEALTKDQARRASTRVSNELRRRQRLVESEIERLGLAATGEVSVYGKIELRK